jgi:TolB protein
MRRFVLVLISALCVLSVAGVPAAEATFPGGDGRLALWAFRARGPSQIITMEPDGTGRQNLMPLGDNAFPAWSADGAEIVFIGTKGLITMHADGTGRHRLLEPSRRRPVLERPTWSPDGTQIVFDAFVADIGGYRLFVIDADGTGLRMIDSPGPDEYYPEWSPDGSRIVFLSDGAEGTFITTMDPDGTDRETVTQGTGLVSWSPDGSKLAFAGARVDDVFVVNEDGTGRARLTETARPEYAPVFSPDGGDIEFSRGTGGPYRTTDTWIMDADGGSPTRITDTERRSEIVSSWQAGE